ncbi:MAG: hypothetical protein EB059_10100 [Alphaproteobacteria bacterium]|nr:hypothetical protein [Alphaproteobacteria bacterium]
MNKWTHQLRQNIQHHAGHIEFFNHLKTAAYTQYGKHSMHKDIAFVPAGLHPHYSLNLQHDLLCWPETDIHELTAYQPFARIVRGQALKVTEPEQKRFVLTLDDGKCMDAGRMDGSLYAACLNSTGQILEWFSF